MMEPEVVSSLLSNSLKKNNIKLGRLKTGTTPRLLSSTINYKKLEEQRSEIPEIYFSFMNNFNDNINNKIFTFCYLTNTNNKACDYYRSKIDEIDKIEASNSGPRYCPSFDDKLIKFPNNVNHQIFLEPEVLSIDNNFTIFPNGINTSLPLKYQQEFVNLIPGLENALIIRPGYRVSYDYVLPDQLDNNLMLKNIQGLFLAGQINGTTGYEEAAVQGAIAGINVYLYLNDKPKLQLPRKTGFIPILIDDLINKIHFEPYRMFTSKSEYRFNHRCDNAIERYLDFINEYKNIFYDNKFVQSANKFVENKKILKNIFENTIYLNNISYYDAIFKNHISFDYLKNNIKGNFDDIVVRSLRNDIKYNIFMNKSYLGNNRLNNLDRLEISEDIYKDIIGNVSNEERDIITKYYPKSIIQLKQFSGIRYDTISLLRNKLIKLIK